MSHYEHSAMVVIIGIRGIVRELSVGRNRFSFLLSALFFVVVEFSTIPAFDRVVLVAWFGRIAPPSVELCRVFLASWQWWEVRSRVD